MSQTIELGSARIEEEPVSANLRFANYSLARFIKSSERSKTRLLTKAGSYAGALLLSAIGMGLAANNAAADSKPLTDLPAVPMRPMTSSAGEFSPAKWTGAAKQPTFDTALQRMDLVQDLVSDQDGQDRNVYVKESLWVSPGQVGPNEEDFANLENSIKAAEVDGDHVCLAVWPFTWGKGHDHLLPPLTGNKRWQYTTFLSTVAHRLRADFGQDPVDCWFIGDEPNNSTFWWPQYTSQGTDAAAPAYENLLARSYDTLKAISPDFMVIGGELASHGNDKPKAKHKSHSPEAFIKDLGKAYRDSGRTKPIMDVFGYHPYGLSSAESPDVVHTDPKMIGEADYPRLVANLSAAFNGTPQKGSELPIIYSEYGDESRTDGPQAYRYHRSEPKTSGAVDEIQQAKNYNTYLRLAACQPNVIGALIFHTMDESDRKGWQSGVYYADGSPKTSQPSVAKGMEDLSIGGIKCS